VELVVDNVALGQVFSNYLFSPANSHSIIIITIIISTEAGTIGQLVANIPGELSPTPSQVTKRILQLVLCTYCTYIANFLDFWNIRRWRKLGSK
jgi:hypothetical protein